MARRPGLSEQIVIQAAIDLVNEQGLENLSIAEIAKRLNVRPPSLYNHVEGLDGLKHAMRLHWLRELANTLQQAAMGRSGTEALRAVAIAYRDFAKLNPGMYPLTARSTQNTDDATQAVEQAVLAVILAVLRGYDLTDDSALHATRCLRSALHGFVSLETSGGFGMVLNVDESFEQLITLLDYGLQHGFEHKR